MTAKKIDELKRLYAQIANVPLGGIGGRIVNAFPELIAALEAAEEERDRLDQLGQKATDELDEVNLQLGVATARAEEAETEVRRWRAIADIRKVVADKYRDWVRRSLDKQKEYLDLAAYFNGEDPARDARLKNEGAAEWLENAAREGGYYERSSEGMLEEAAELRRKGING